MQKKVEKISRKACFACNSMNFKVPCFLLYEIMKFQKVLERKVEKSRTSKVVFTIKWTYMKPLNTLSGSPFQSLFVAAHFKLGIRNGEIS